MEDWYNCQSGLQLAHHRPWLLMLKPKNAQEGVRLLSVGEPDFDTPEHKRSCHTALRQVADIRGENSKLKRR